MYPKDDFNQRLQLAIKRPAMKQIVIEIQESYGDVKNRTLDMPREALDSMEYSSGILEISYHHPEMGTVTEFISWDRIRSIVFRDKVVKWSPFPLPHNSHTID